MEPHQQALGTVQAKLQQMQAEIATITAQQKFFEEAYKK
jgi:hypothetical protein